MDFQKNLGSLLPKFFIIFSITRTIRVYAILHVISDVLTGMYNFHRSAEFCLVRNFQSHFEIRLDPRRKYFIQRVGTINIFGHKKENIHLSLHA